MRKAVLKVRPNPATPNTPWQIDYRVEGKRRREFFRTKTHAQHELTRIKIKIEQGGERALSLPDHLRIAALRIEQELQPFGKSLRDAGTHYLNFLRESQRSITVSALRDEYLALKQTKGLSEIHLTDLRNRYAIFCADFGDTPVRTIEARQIESWLNARQFGSQNWNNNRSRIGALFAYALKHDYASANPVKKIDPIKFVGDEPAIWTPDELARILEAAPADILPLIALGAFAGIRPKELVRLDWQDIDFEHGELTISKAKAKTASRRVIKMESNLREWLAPFKGRTGLIFTGPNTLLHRMKQVSKAAGIPDWRADGFRHSFASYHYARYNDAARSAADLGHTTTALLFQKYRSLVRPEEAQRYWNIFPARTAANVVPMAS